MGKSPINLEELTKITYADAEALGDRTFLLMPMWDGEKWHSWFPRGDGTLVKMQPVDVVSSAYVGKTSAAPRDLWVPFIDLLWQRANWPEAYPLISALCDDFQNLGTSVAKLRHFFEHRNTISKDAVAPFVATELEYIVISARTVFDLLQEAIAHIWNRRIRLLDDDAEAIRKKHRLPTSFSKLVLKDKADIESAASLVEKHAISPELAAAYIKHARFFLTLRNARDHIVHGGNSDLARIFVTEKGFCVAPSDPAFSVYHIWKDDHRYNENVSSLLPWIAHVAFGTIGACTEILEAFATRIHLPPEIAPGYRVFVRDHSSAAWLDLQRAHRGELIWWGDSS